MTSFNHTTDTTCNGNVTNLRDRCNHPLCTVCDNTLQKRFTAKVMKTFENIPLEHLRKISINLKALPHDITPGDYQQVMRATRKLLIDRIKALPDTEYLTIHGALEIAITETTNIWNLHFHGTMLNCAMTDEELKQELRRHYTSCRAIRIEHYSTGKYAGMSRAEQLRGWSGYAVKYKSKRIPNKYLNRYFTLMNSVMSGGTRGLELYINKGNDILKPGILEGMMK